MSYYRNQRSKKRKKLVIITFLVLVLLITSLVIFLNNDNSGVAIKDGIIEINREFSFQAKEKSVKLNTNKIAVPIIDKNKIQTSTKAKTKTLKSNTTKKELTLELDLLVPIK